MRFNDFFIFVINETFLFWCFELKGYNGLMCLVILDLRNIFGLEFNYVLSIILCVFIFIILC